MSQVTTPCVKVLLSALQVSIGPCQISGDQHQIGRLVWVRSKRETAQCINCLRVRIPQVGTIVNFYVTGGVLSSDRSFRSDNGTCKPRVPCLRIDWSLRMSLRENLSYNVPFEIFQMVRDYVQKFQLIDSPRLGIARRIALGIISE